MVISPFSCWLNVLADSFEGVIAFALVAAVLLAGTALLFAGLAALMVTTRTLAHEA